MSDIALNTSSNLINNANNAVDGVEKKDIYDEIAGQVVDELWDKCTSQDSFEKLETAKKPSKLGRIIARIAGGILLGAGLAAAAAATVVSLGVAPAIIAAAATAIGGIAGTSIAAGVTGAAGIACLAGSFVGGRSAEAFVEGQHSKHSTNDNLAMITNGKVTAKAPNTVQVETFSGLRRAFNVDDKVAATGFRVNTKGVHLAKIHILVAIYVQFECTPFVCPEEARPNRDSAFERLAVQQFYFRASEVGANQLQTIRLQAIYRIGGQELLKTAVTAYPRSLTRTCKMVEVGVLHLELYSIRGTRVGYY